jgi:hypothetical protein
MKRIASKRDANRLVKYLQARVAKDALQIPVAVLPLDVIPEVVLKRAVPRRAKGVPKAKRVWPAAK